MSEVARVGVSIGYTINGRGNATTGWLVCGSPWGADSPLDLISKPLDVGEHKWRVRWVNAPSVGPIRIGDRIDLKLEVRRD